MAKQAEMTQWLQQRVGLMSKAGSRDSDVKLHASLCTLVACMFTTAGLELTTPHESKCWQLQTTLVDCLFEHYITCTCKQSNNQF